MEDRKHCPDCGAAVGEPHRDDCDVERCTVCASQRTSCSCADHDPEASVWTGAWPSSRAVMGGGFTQPPGQAASARTAAGASRLVKNAAGSLALARKIRAKPKQCFHNAWRAVERSGASAVYVEGFAVARKGFAFEHGWLERDGEIFDPSLPEDPLTYFPGLRFEGAEGLRQAQDIPGMGECGSYLPIYYRLAWGSSSPEFTAAREAASAYCEALGRLRAACRAAAEP
jgi:hypothetical protein